MEMKVEILSRTLVKPFSSTPNDLRNYKLSLLDQFIPEFHIGIVFFYSPTTNNDQSFNEKSQTLKKSLSETLTLFYPIAGRFKDTATIDCNDEGSCLIEAKINSKLSDFLDQPGLETVGKLVPTLDSETMEMATKCLLIVQATLFECGGMAISFCFEHRFGDMSSEVTFLKNWIAIARGFDQELELDIPIFNGASFLPPIDLPPLPAVDNPIERRKTTRLVFESSKIAALKKLSGQEHLSRVEVVLALILKSAITATRSISSSSSTAQSVIFQSVNLRKRLVPPLPENSIGNLFWSLPALIEEKFMEFHEIVAKIREVKMEFYEEKVHKIKDSDEGRLLIFESLKERGEIMFKIDDPNLYMCSSWCNFPFYEMDFGWGKPIWVSNGVFSSRNVIVLEDTKCGTGIEAWVNLAPQIMSLFERDEELLSFALLNPKVPHLS
ncbi:hypothetical protein UlMin_007556 [Ulmus minor]